MLESEKPNITIMVESNHLEGHTLLSGHDDYIIEGDQVKVDKIIG